MYFYAWADCSHTDTRILHTHPAAEPRPQNGNVATQNTNQVTSSAGSTGSMIPRNHGHAQSPNLRYLFSFILHVFKIGLLAPKLLGREKDRQAESLYRSYFSMKLVSDKAGKGLKRSPRLSGCPKAGAALPTPVLTDVCLPCTRH